jgi:hypothetical protein
MASPSPAADAATTNDLLAAIRDHLNTPLPASADDEQRYEYLLRDRVASVLGIIDAVLDSGGHDVAADVGISTLRRRARLQPPTYRPYVPDACGEACNAPVDGVHDSCPGPHVDATVEDAR